MDSFKGGLRKNRISVEEPRDRKKWVDTYWVLLDDREWGKKIHIEGREQFSI